jgi:hypothetical protein
MLPGAATDCRRTDPDQFEPTWEWLDEADEDEYGPDDLDWASMTEAERDIVQDAIRQAEAEDEQDREAHRQP